MKQREPREPICPDGIIQGNPALKSVIKTTGKNPRIFFHQEDIDNHCTFTCTNAHLCTEEHKKTIVEIFASYDFPHTQAFLSKKAQASEQKDKLPEGHLCPEGLIEGPSLVQAIINKKLPNHGLFFDHQEVIDHCTRYCQSTKECTEKYKHTIANIFKSYGKPVVEPVSEATIG